MLVGHPFVQGASAHLAEYNHSRVSESVETEGNSEFFKVPQAPLCLHNSRSVVELRSVVAKVVCKISTMWRLLHPLEFVACRLFCPSWDNRGPLSYGCMSLVRIEIARRRKIQK